MSQDQKLMEQEIQTQTTSDGKSETEKIIDDINSIIEKISTNHPITKNKKIQKKSTNSFQPAPTTTSLKTKKNSNP